MTLLMTSQRDVKVGWIQEMDTYSAYLSKSQYIQSYWFSNQSDINIVYNISVITIIITTSIILANFGKYAISDCPFICLSVCPSVRPSVCLSVTPFWLCSHHRIIMKFSGVITTDQCNVHAKGQGQRSKVKVTEVTTQLYRFRTVTPVWIHIWWWNDAYSLMLLRRGALLFFKVIRQISRSHSFKNRRVWPRLGVSGL